MWRVLVRQFGGRANRIVPPDFSADPLKRYCPHAVQSSLIHSFFVHGRKAIVAEKEFAEIFLFRMGQKERKNKEVQKKKETRLV